MEKVVQRFDSHEAAHLADVRYYRSLTPVERLDILFDLVNQREDRDEAGSRLERVYRITQFPER